MAEKEIEKALIELVNYVIPFKGVFLEEYQKFDLYIYNEKILESILNEFKFKTIGNVFDFPQLPQPESVYQHQMIGNQKYYNRFFISKKNNSIAVIYTEGRALNAIFFIDKPKMKKFSKMAREILKKDWSNNLFTDTDFDCKYGEYIEICENLDEGKHKSGITTVKQKVNNEHLIFDELSELVNVINDIQKFFKKETKKLYEKLEITYKRGIILHGDPGNGKSAMIREIIRTLPEITKVIFTSSLPDFTKVLGSLVKNLEGKRAIVIFEDIDSMIDEYNRSEFLNILDGIGINSGLYFIGTTNYPEKIDPAFVNRAGRFDRSFKIGNPSDITRFKFFKSRNLDSILVGCKLFKDDKVNASEDSICNLFTKYSEGLPMASLKELITSTSYALVQNKELSLEEALKPTLDILKSDREEHTESHNRFKYNKIKKRDYCSDGDEY